MFSHTHKGQAYNTPLLSRFVAPTGASESVKTHYPRLIDYELLTDDEGRRTVGFGWYAGGMYHLFIRCGHKCSPWCSRWSLGSPLVDGPSPSRDGNRLSVLVHAATTHCIFAGSSSITTSPSGAAYRHAWHSRAPWSIRYRGYRVSVHAVRSLPCGCHSCGGSPI